MSESWVNAPEFIPGARYVPRPSTSTQAAATPPTAPTSHYGPTSAAAPPTAPQCSYSEIVQTPTKNTQGPSSCREGHNEASALSSTSSCREARLANNAASALSSTREARFANEALSSTSRPSIRGFSDYSKSAATESAASESAGSKSGASESAGSSGQLCSYHLNDEVCPDGSECVNIHGELCQHCGLNCLPPGDNAKIKYHQDICESIKRQEQKYAAAAEASKEITCSICLEVVMEKTDKKSRRFGLLSECRHPFCVECIRKWRSSQANDNTRRRCPMCRKTSYFIIPSEVWVTDSGEKDQLVQGYKEHLATKDCMHFNRGRDHCPFGANCFYKHALPDGTIISDNVVQRRVDHEENFSISATILLSDFLDELITFQETFQTLFHNRDL